MKKFPLIILGIAGGLLLGLGLPFGCKKVNPTGKHVMVIGDSQSKFAGGWQDQIATMYNFGKLTNLSEGGKYTSWLLKNRFIPYFANSANPIPEILFIWGGSGNDGDSMIPKDTTYSNVQQMVDIARAKGVKYVYVFSGFNRDKTIVPANPYYNRLSAPYKNPKNRTNYREMSLGMPSAIKNADCVIPQFQNVNANSTMDGIHLKIKPDMTNLASWIGQQIFLR